MRANKRDKNNLSFEQNVEYKVLDIVELLSKNLFIVNVKIKKPNCAIIKNKNYVFKIKTTFLSSVEIKKIIEDKIKKKLKLI